MINGLLFLNCISTVESATENYINDVNNTSLTYFSVNFAGLEFKFNQFYKIMCL